MKVIFDFDDVIFNAKGFKTAMFGILKEKGYGDVEKKYIDVRLREAPFSLFDFLREVDDTLTSSTQEELYQEILRVSEHVINHDIVDVMKRLGKKHCYVVTSGDARFQKDKIIRSVGEGVAQEVFVVPGSKKEVIQMLCQRHLNEEVIFVDDKLGFFNDLEMEACQNLKTILYNENGLANLEAEIAESEKMEQEKSEASKPGPDQSFGMH